MVSVLNRIKNYIPKPSTVLKKGIGLATLGYVAYDANYVGKMQADLYASEKDANSTGYYLNNAMYGANMSKTEELIRDKSFRMELDTTWKRFINSGIGYIKGFTTMLIDHVVPLGLGIGTLCGGKITSKASAIGLGIYGTYEFLRTFFGVGTPKGLRDAFK